MLFLYKIRDIWEEIKVSYGVFIPFLILIIIFIIIIIIRRKDDN